MISDITTHRGQLYVSAQPLPDCAARSVAIDFRCLNVGALVFMLQAEIMATREPRAWMGLTADRRTARVCAYCPDKAKAERRADALNLSVTHGACPECLAKLMANLTP
jgi:hypothetical protein